MKVRFLMGKRRLTRLGATWSVGMLVVLVVAACQAPPANRVDNAVQSARPSEIAATATALPPTVAPVVFAASSIATATAVPPPTEAAIPTITPVSAGGSGVFTTVVIAGATPTIDASQRRVRLTVPTIA